MPSDDSTEARTVVCHTAAGRGGRHERCPRGQLVKMGTARGRSVKPGLKVGICGEHGGAATADK
jgi:hypothetical protein